MQALRGQRQAAIAPAHEVDLASEAGQRQRPCHQLRLLEMEQRQRRHDADAEPGAHHAHHCCELLDFHQRVHLLRMERGLQVLAHAARARQVDERPCGEVAHAQLACARERMVGAAHEVEVVAAEQLGAQLGCVGTDRREREIGAPARDALDARLRQCVGDLELDARVRRAVTGQHAGQPARRERRQQRERNAAAAARRMVAHSRQRAVEFAEHAPRRAFERAALDGQLHMPRAAVEQPQPERVFERADERAERRLRQVRQRRCAREAALLGQRDERAQLAHRDIHLWNG